VDLAPFKLVTNQEEWQSCLNSLQTQSRLAIDLEANSLYAYREQICLIQITIPSQDFIIDPLSNLDLSELGNLISNPQLEKVFHAAEYDMILIKRQFGWQLENLFDTMWAARILGYNRCGLANLLNSSYGVTLNKKHQKANWSQRPLPHNQLRYAQMDTHFLLSLRDDLFFELDEADCLAEAKEIFEEQCQVQVNNNRFEPDGFWSVSGIRNLTARQQAIVKELWIYRNSNAKHLDRPPFKVFDDRTIIELAAVAPRYREELLDIHGMSRGQIRRYGHQLLKVIREAESGPLPKKPKSKRTRTPDVVSSRFDKLRNWRKNRARHRGVESDVILSREALWELAWANPQNGEQLSQIGSMGPWRRETYGHEILKLLRRRSA
jgi:ribonuclease D